MTRKTWLATGQICLLLWVGGCTALAPSAPGPVRRQDTVVSLTFDDGDADNFAAGAVLQQYGLRATFYIPTGLVGTPGFMTWEQLQELHKAGHEIGGHTLDHINIGGLEAAALRHQICDDRQNLAERGFEPLSFAYPYGGYDQAARQMVRDCGYSDARTIGAGPEQVPPPDPYELRAFPYIDGNSQADKLQRYVADTRKDRGGWVILIFHHVCEGCDPLAVRPEVFGTFVQWLADQQVQGHVTVQTVGGVLTKATAP